MTHPSSTEFSTARQRAGLDRDATAALFDVTPAVVDAWEAGTLAVPRRVGQEIAWRAATVERTAALAESGLPACDWVAAWHREPMPRRLRQRTQHVRVLESHVAGCDTCLARDRFLAERFSPMPARPMPAWMAALGWLNLRIGRLPAWLRPAAVGALLFVAITALRALLAAPEWIHTPGGWRTALTALPLSAAAGAVIGTLYGGLRAARTRSRSG